MQTCNTFYQLMCELNESWNVSKLRIFDWMTNQLCTNANGLQCWKKIQISSISMGKSKMVSKLPDKICVKLMQWNTIF